MKIERELSRPKEKINWLDANSIRDRGRIPKLRLPEEIKLKKSLKKIEKELEILED